jgi:hypothetical protein
MNGTGSFPLRVEMNQKKWTGDELRCEEEGEKKLGGLGHEGKP